MNQMLATKDSKKQVIIIIIIIIIIIYEISIFFLNKSIEKGVFTFLTASNNKVDS